MVDHMEVPKYKPEGRSVSICEERHFEIPRVYRCESETDSACERKGSATSFLLPAVNLARRLSMRITGNRDGNQPRKRKRRAPRGESKLFPNGRRKSLFEGRSSIAQLSLDMERGILIIKEEEPNPIINIFNTGMKRLRHLLGLPYSGVPTVQVPEVESISLQQIEAPHRYRPNSIKQLSIATGFSEPELKRLYRGFKTECPTGVVDEESFHNIYTHLFPWGEENYHPYICSYSHYVFSMLDEGGKGIVTFEDFVLALSLLYHGTEEEKIAWAFRLYDLNGDGVIQKDEMCDVAIAVFELMGKPDMENPATIEHIMEKIGDIFETMDTNEDGVVSLDEFISFNRCEDFEVNSQNVLSGFRLAPKPASSSTTRATP